MFGNALCAIALSIMWCPLIRSEMSTPFVAIDKAPADRAYNLGGKTAVIGTKEYGGLVIAAGPCDTPSAVSFDPGNSSPMV